jgi:hypothetical protein
VRLESQQRLERRIMTSLRPVLALGLAAGVAAGAVAIAAPKPSAKPIPARVVAAAPVARSSGGDVTVSLYPSLVNVRLVRAQSLLDDATSAQSRGDATGAAAALTAARPQLAKAWTGAKYVIENAPPPVAGDGALGHSSGGVIAGASPYADQYATAAAVLALQHNVAVTAMGMLDTASEPLLTAVSKTVFAALNARDAAIAYVHAIPAPPPVAADGSVRAGASGAPIVSGWGSTMQAISPDVDDELQMLDGIRASTTLSPGRKRVLDAVELQNTKTGRKITQLWPPVVGG